MKTGFRFTRRGNRGDTFYCVDSRTSKRTSLQTISGDAARQNVAANNQAERQPVLEPR